MRRDVFQGIADPTRRQILNLIAHRSLNVNSVASKFDVSRTAIYKHMKILLECGLMEIKQLGRERFCEAKLKKLNKVSHWINQYRENWESPFDSLNEYLHKAKANRKPANKK
jgi:DNA-binding transcriptional ArsR family regulator